MSSDLSFAHLVEDGKGLPAEALDKVDVSSADDLWVGVEVDAVVVPPQQKIPPGLDMRDLHGVTDGLDVSAGSSYSLLQSVSQLSFSVFFQLETCL